MTQTWLKAVYFAGLLAEVVVRAPWERRRRQIRKTDQRVTGSEYGVLVGIFLGMLALPVVYSLTPWLRFADYRLSETARKGAGSVGSALLAAGAWLFWRSHRDLGTNWSPSLEIGAEHTLMTQGVYGKIRHPMYASQLLWGAAQALLLQNWVAGPASLVAFLPLYFVRVPQEERMMLDHFGEAYRAYCARTGRLVPKLFG